MNSKTKVIIKAAETGENLHRNDRGGEIEALTKKIIQIENALEELESQARPET